MKLNYCYLLNFKRVLLGITLISICSAAWAQRTVTGTVTGAQDNSPIAGAAVLIKGTTTGAYTDAEGNYTVSVPEGSEALVFSYFGFATQEIPIGDQTEINVALEQSVGSLDEIVVTGYTTQREKEKTSAISSVKAEDFNQGNVNNPVQLIQGKVAGINISRPGSDPNQNFNIRLRGLGTLGANSQPLVIIDGVLNADLNSVDPNDIASFDVLKDGSAAAIYGTQAASGVLIITTKKGIPGESKIDYNGYVTAEYIDQTVEVLDREQFLSIDGTTDYGSDTDWVEELTQTGITHVHNLSLSGGSQTTSYRASVNFRDIQGIAKESGFDQLNGRLNLQQKAFDGKMIVNMNLTSTVRNEQLASRDNAAFRQAIIYNPTAPVRSDDPAFDIYDGYFQQTLFDFFNPVAIVEQNQFENKRNNLLGSIDGSFEIIEGLKVGARYSIQRETLLEGDYIDKNSIGTGRDRNGFARRLHEQYFNELMETTVNYDTEIAGWRLNLLGGYSYQEFLNEGFGVAGGDFISDEFGFDNLGASQDFPNGLGGVGSFKNSNKLIAGFGRIQINSPDDTYILSAVVRREGSTRFGEDNKWGTFPGASGAITLSNLITIPSVDNLKLRAGFGVTGAQPNDSYLSLFRLGPVGNFFFNGEFVPSYGPVSNPNPNLQWEEKTDFNVGVDFSMLNYRLSGSLEYYTSTTDNAIIPQDVPVPPNLFDQTFTNIGEISQSGIEATIEYAIFDQPNFSWTSNVVFTYYLDNTLEQFIGEGTDDRANLGSPGQNATPLIRVEEGQPIGQIWGLKFEGIGENGQWLFADTDGDGNPGEDEDRQVIGSGVPDMQVGWANTLRYGNFDLNFFFRGVFGHDLVNTFRALYGAPSSTSTYNVPVTVLDILNLTDAPKFSSYHVEDADFVKLDNVTLGYTIPIAEEWGFNRLRVYVTGQNLFTITDYTGVDPESRQVDGDDPGDPLAPGIDRRNTYFRASGVTFGVNVGF